MFRFSDWLSHLRPDFWKSYYSHPELLSLFSYINSVKGAQAVGYDLMSLYDIVDIGEHLPGYTVVWQQLYFTTNSYVAGSDYPYQFDIDDSWIYIDCLHDKQVDPSVTLQYGVDFIVLPGKLCFIKPFAYDMLYVSKGQKAATRLADDIGTAFGFIRKDGYRYRDDMVAMMELFYGGPCIHNIVAAANVMVNNPVAKYGDETILSVDGGNVITDKYSYSLAKASRAYSVGETVTKHSPLSEVIELSTQKTHPEWWLDRIPQMFQKYKVDGAIDATQRDLMMDEFLKYFVAHIRINLNKTDWRTYRYFPDLWDLLLDGSPVRTDYILSMYYHALDLDMPLPDFDVCKIRLDAFSIWGKRWVPGAEGWLCTDKLVVPIIYSDDSAEKDMSWYIGSDRWHILDDDKSDHEFWSQEEFHESYVEPTWDRWVIKQGKDTEIPIVSKKAVSYSMPKVEQIGAKVSVREPASPNEIIDYIPKANNYSDFYMHFIYGDQNVSHEELDDWTYSGVHLSVEGIAGSVLNATGYATSPPLYVGGIPKNVTVRPVIALAKNTSVTVYYSLDKSTWVALPESKLIPSVKENIYFKAEITTSGITSPVFKGLDISIRAIGGQK